jgi:adenylate cyclase
MTVDIITDLGKLSGLFVIAANSVFTYKGKAVKIEEVGKQLGVRYVLEGNARAVNDRVRISARLIDATTGGHLWAQNYDRDVKDIFAVQDEIVQEIVAILAVKVTEEDQRRLLRKATDNLQAYETAVQAAKYFLQSTKEKNVQARELYARAVELDPKFAGAYAGVAATYVQEWAWQWGQDPWALDLSYTLIQKALVLDPSSSHAHLTLANVYLFQKQHEQAIAEAQTAIALNPNWADAYFVLGYILAFAGQPEDTLGAVEKAMRLNPFYPPRYPWCIGRAYRMLGQYEEAVTIQKQVLSKNPSYLSARADLAVTYIELEQEAEAREQVAEILKISPKYSLAVAGQRVPFKNSVDLEHFISGLRKAGLQ